MSQAPARMLVLIGERFACVKIVGRANFTSSIDFKTLVTELQEKGYQYFVLDLSECVLMDSTFLGVLAGLGLKLSGGDGDPCERGVELLNPNPRIAELLESLGVLHLFNVTQGTVTLAAHPEEHPLQSAEPSKVEITRACLEAHQTLMDINTANVPKFKEVTQFLAEKLRALGTP